ncbi:MAG: outer membrane beta-barrel protein [Elusimicrobiota bacterium]
MKSSAAALFALLFASGAAAYEGGSASATSIGPRYAFFHPDDADHGEWAPGVQLGLHLTPLYSFQASVDFAHYTSGTTNVRSTPIQATVLGYFSPSGSGLAPYLLLGGGWYPTHADGPYRPSRLFGPHVGAGMTIPIGRNWSIDGSYRFMWMETIGWSVMNPQHMFGEDFAVRGHMFTIGVNYSL